MFEPIEKTLDVIVSYMEEPPQAKLYDAKNNVAPN